MGICYHTKPKMERVSQTKQHIANQWQKLMEQNFSSRTKTKWQIPFFSIFLTSGDQQFFLFTLVNLQTLLLGMTIRNPDTKMSTLSGVLQPNQDKEYLNEFACMCGALQLVLAGRGVLFIRICVQHLLIANQSLPCHPSASVQFACMPSVS